MEENVSNALLMAGAMLIFVIAVSVVFPLISQTKEVSDHILYSYDDTKYYDEGYEGITYTLADEKNIARIVTMETIMPTAARYIKENYGVTIVNKKDGIIARFDSTTESLVHDWINQLNNEKAGKSKKCSKHFDYLKKLEEAVSIGDEKVDFKIGDEFNVSTNNLSSLWERIYKLENRKSGSGKLNFATPWQSEDKEIAKRLKADFGTEAAEYAIGTYPAKNLLKKYSDKKFKELYVFVVEDNDGVEKDDYTGDSVITKASSSKLEIIYVEE